MGVQTHTSEFEHMLADFGRQTSLKRIRKRIATTSAAVIVHEPDGRLVLFNEAACHLMHRSGAAMLGLGPFGWVGRRGHPGAAQRLERILHGNPARFVSSVVLPDGSEVPTLVASARVDTDAGPVLVASITAAE